jgi:hypothetical protein
MLAKRRLGAGLLSRRRLVLTAVAILLVPVLLAAAGFAGLLGEDAGSVPAAVPAGGADGLWLGHAWVDGRHTPADLNALIGRLRKTGIRDLFVHVGPLSEDGSLNPALRPRARWLLTGLHRRLPQVRVQAWLGDLVGPGGLDLASRATGARLLAADAQVLAEGFDGIHYDLEPVPSGDRGYLALLTATHDLTRARHGVLSVACDQIEPAPYLHVVDQLIFGHPHWWSAAYLRAIASRADEVALMTYDTGVPTGAAYSGSRRGSAGRHLAHRAARLPRQRARPYERGNGRRGHPRRPPGPGRPPAAPPGRCRALRRLLRPPGRLGGLSRRLGGLAGVQRGVGAGHPFSLAIAVPGRRCLLRGPAPVADPPRPRWPIRPGSGGRSAPAPVAAGPRFRDWFGCCLSWTVRSEPLTNFHRSPVRTASPARWAGSATAPSPARPPRAIQAAGAASHAGTAGLPGPRSCSTGA